MDQIFGVLHLFEAAFQFSNLHHSELTKQWVAASFKSRASPILHEFFVETQRIGQLDVLIRCAEEEIASAYSLNRQDDLPLLGTNLLFALSYSWISLSYELFRSVRQRTKVEVFTDFFQELQMVRVQELKSEIAGFGSAKKAGLTVQLIRSEESRKGTESYVHGKTILNSSLGVRTSDGSIGWNVFDVRKRKQIAIFRRDLSDKIISSLLSDV